jgi:hypothetical protein
VFADSLLHAPSVFTVMRKQHISTKKKNKL